jgi:hypothetical protein
VITVQRRFLNPVLTCAAATAVVLFSAVPASAVRTTGIVDHTTTSDEGACFFEPGDVPGVDTFFPATCIFVHVPNGDLQVVARAMLPEGYSLIRPFSGPLASCFGGSGRVVATTSGSVQATCRIPG